MSKKILITGGNGQLGKALSYYLCNKFDIISTSREKLSLDPTYNTDILDITNIDNIKNIMDAYHPNIIINCAAYTNVDGCETNKEHAHLVNVGGLNNLIKSSAPDANIIQISSDYIFDGEFGPYSENDHAYPINYYGKTKLEAENILRGSRRRSLIIRPNVLYSEDLYSKGNFFAYVYKSLINNKPISIVNDQKSNPSYVEYLCELVFKCILLNTEGIFHFGSDDYMSRYDFAIKIAKIFNLNDQLINSVNTKTLSNKVQQYRAKRPKHSGLQTSKIESEIGFSSLSVNYSLSEIKRHFVHL